MERPILSLTSKHFLQGLAPSAHTEKGGLFFKANGVTPLYDPGGTASVENGLLQAGPTPVNIGGSTVVDTIFAAASGTIVATHRTFFYGENGHIYQLLTNGNLTDVHTNANAAKAGLVVWSPNGTDAGLWYWGTGQIGLYNGTSFNDNYKAVTGIMPKYCSPHRFGFDVYYVANAGTRIDKLVGSTTAGGVTVSEGLLSFEQKFQPFALTDDGIYLVVALNSNSEGDNVFAESRVLFWDTLSSGWQREYSIRDPFIWALKHIGSTVYAFGQYGVYVGSFDRGFKKILPRLIGFGTTADLTSGYGAFRADIYNQDAIVFGTDTTIDTIGSLSPEIPPAYYKHFLVPSGVGTPTCVFSRFAVGSIYVATDGSKLYRYDFNGSTRETSVNFQTIYLPFKEKTQVHRIDVIFGEPLSSGDAFDIDTKIDEDTAAVDFGAASFAADGAIRRKAMYPNKPVEVNEQFSLIGNFTGGAPKIKTIHIFGLPMTA